jgi:hypothetical protein
VVSTLRLVPTSGPAKLRCARSPVWTLDATQHGTKPGGPVDDPDITELGPQGVTIALTSETLSIAAEPGRTLRLRWRDGSDAVLSDEQVPTEKGNSLREVVVTAPPLATSLWLTAHGGGPLRVGRIADGASPP